MHLPVMALSLQNIIVMIMTLSVVSILTGMSFIEYQINVSRIPLDMCPDDAAWQGVGTLFKNRFLRETNDDDYGVRSDTADIGPTYIPTVPNIYIQKSANIHEEVIKRLTSQELQIYWDALTSFKKRTKIAFKDLAPSQKWGVATTIMNSFGYRQRLPDVINIGAKKGATTPLRFFLGFHPDIVNTVTGRAAEFFDKNFHKGAEWYRRCMGFSREHQVVYEKTPNYLVSDTVPEKITQVLPRTTKFLLLVRDPVERSLSDFRHVRELRRPKEWCLKQSAESEGRRFEEAVLDESGNVNPDNPIISASTYVKHFKRWLRYFPKSQFLILDQELIVGYTFLELQRIEQFLNITPFFRPEMFVFDNDIPGTCINIARKLCPGRASRGTLTKPRPSNETIRKLRQYFRPYNQEFSQITEKSFHWINY
ncbi:Heparan sulfate glucosamine 3-O-sulfotransferase 5 [Holothuria leucospilota]|uniref:Heparan sulfate glucosamine 3-O-sulfotransferase 5 n=1 Tax=Holothuria leucospilota TaxID=206669 RepID=A0A9Q1CLH2_HOLLE|nr:Heparan sulfate glucosamine 3-O-sulfotransferase 5 [Holothuria leucospilota]